MSKTQTLLDIISRVDSGTKVRLIGDPLQFYQMYGRVTKNRNNYPLHSLVGNTNRMIVLDDFWGYSSPYDEKALREKIDKDLGKGYTKLQDPPRFDEFVKADEFRNRGKKKVYTPPAAPKIKKSKKEKEKEPTLEEKLHQSYVDMEYERKKAESDIIAKDLQEYTEAKELAEHIARQEEMSKFKNSGGSWASGFGNFKPSRPTIGPANLPGGGTFKYPNMKQVMISAKGFQMGQIAPIKGVKKI